MKSNILKISLISLSSLISLVSCNDHKDNNDEYVSTSFNELTGYKFVLKDNKQLPTKVIKNSELSFKVEVSEGYSTNYEVYANDYKLTLENEYYTYKVIENTTFFITNSDDEEVRYKITPLFDLNDISITYVVDDKIVNQPENGFLKNTDLYMQFTFYGYDPESNYKVLINDNEVDPIERNNHEFYYYKVTQNATIKITGLEKQKLSVTYNVPQDVSLTLKDGGELPTTIEIGSSLEIKMVINSDKKYGLYANGNRYYADEEGIYTISNISTNLRIDVKEISDGPTIDKNSSIDSIYNFLTNLTNSNGRYKVSFNEGYTLHHPSYLYQEYKNEGYVSLNRADKTDGSKALYHFKFDENDKVKVGGLAIENNELDPSKYEIISDTSHYDPSLDLKVDGRLTKDKFTKKLTYGVVSEDSYIINFFTELSEASGSNYSMVVISTSESELVYKLYRYVDNGYETDEYSWGKISEVAIANDARLDSYIASNPNLGISLKNEQVSNLVKDNVSVHSELAIVNVDSTGNIVKSKGVSTDVIINKDMFRVSEDFPDYDDKVVRTFKNVNGVSNLVGIGGDNKPYYKDSDGNWSQYLFPNDINYSAFRQDSADSNLYHYYGEEANKFIFTMSRVGFTNGLSIEDLTLKVEDNKAKEMIVTYQKEVIDGTTSYYEITLTFKDEEVISLNEFSKESNDADIKKVLSYLKDKTFKGTYSNTSEGIYKEYRKTNEAIYIKDLDSSGRSISEFGYYSINDKLVPFSYDSTNKKYTNTGKGLDKSLNDEACSLASEIFTLKDNSLIVKEGVTAISEFFLTKFLPSGIIDDTLKINFDSEFKPTSINFKLHGANGDYDCVINLLNFDNTKLTDTELKGLSILKDENVKVTTWKEGFLDGYNKLVTLYGEENANLIPFVKPSGNITWKVSGNDTSVNIWSGSGVTVFNEDYLKQFEAALVDAKFNKTNSDTYVLGIIKIIIPSNPVIGLKFEKNQ